MYHKLGVLSSVETNKYKIVDVYEIKKYILIYTK